MTCKYDIVLFDLDGTLSQSHEGVKASIIYALNKLGKPIPEEIDDTSRYIGPPLMDTLENMCKLTHEEALQAADIYKEIYSKENKYKNKCYDGLINILELLKKTGVKLGVATTKYEPFAEEVLKIIGVYDYFDAVGGTTADGRIKEKAQVIPIAVERMGHNMSDKIVLIGDSKFDTEGANELNIDFIGVLYGYGLQKDMIAEGAKIFAEKPDDLITLLMD